MKKKQKKQNSVLISHPSYLLYCFILWCKRASIFIHMICALYSKSIWSQIMIDIVMNLYCVVFIHCCKSRVKIVYVQSQSQRFGVTWGESMKTEWTVPLNRHTQAGFWLCGSWTGIRALILFLRVWKHSNEPLQDQSSNQSRRADERLHLIQQNQDEHHSTVQRHLINICSMHIKHTSLSHRIKQPLLFLFCTLHWMKEPAECIQ